MVKAPDAGRRSALRLGVLLTLAVLLAGCGGVEPSPSVPPPNDATTVSPTETPVSGQPGGTAGERPTPTLRPILPPQTVNDSPEIFLWPPEIRAADGDEFDILVMVDPAGLGISAGELRVRFPAQILEYVDLQPGKLLGESPLVGSKVIDEELGIAEITLARLGKTDPPTEKGYLARITLRLRAGSGTGSYPLSLEAKLLDHQFNDVELSSTSGGLLVIGAGAIQDDGEEKSRIFGSIQSNVEEISSQIQNLTQIVGDMERSPGILPIKKPSSRLDSLDGALRRLMNASDLDSTLFAVGQISIALLDLESALDDDESPLKPPKLKGRIDAARVAISDLELILVDSPVLGGSPVPSPDYPNDPYLNPLNIMWALDNTGQPIARTPFIGANDADIDAPEAWAFTVGSLQTIVAVVDTGVDYTHPDLYRNIWINEGEIPSTARIRLTDVDGDGLITFYDLNEKINQGPDIIEDFDGNGRIDGKDILFRRNCPKVLNGTEDSVPSCDPYPGWVNGLDDDGNGYVDDLIGWDFVDNDNDPMDQHFHGTHVAGIIGAEGNNGLGTVGVNWNVRLMPLRILDPGGPSSYDFFGDGRKDVVKAMRYAADNGADVSNHSWGWNYKDDLPRWAAKVGFDPSDLESLEELADKLGLTEGIREVRSAIRYARDRGHIMVVAAGNGGLDGIGDDTDHPDLRVYPANFDVDNIIAVANTDFNDNLTQSSNFGDLSVGLSAPGQYINSTTPTIETDAMKAKKVLPNYDLLSGTSMAAPHVAGVVALIISQNPGLGYQEVIKIVLATVDRVPSVAGKTISGGRLNARAAVAPGPFVIDADVLRSTDGSVYGIEITFNEGINVGTLTSSDVMLSDPDGQPMAVDSVQPVNNTGDRVWRVDFPTIKDLVGGRYRLTVGPNIRDANGTFMDQDRDGATKETVDDRYVRPFVVRTRISGIEELPKPEVITP